MCYHYPIVWSNQNTTSNMDNVEIVDCRGYFADAYDKTLPIFKCGQGDSTA